MRKKLLLKTTREYLQSSFPENLLPTKKIRQKKAFLYKNRNLKVQIIKAKQRIFKQYSNSTKKLFFSKIFYNPKNFNYNYNSQATTITNLYTDKTKFPMPNFPAVPVRFQSSPSTVGLPNIARTKGQNNGSDRCPTGYGKGTIKIPFLFSTSQINYELSKKAKRFSDFKNQLKERKKLALLYGKLSRKNIQKTLKKASQLSGKKNDNFFFLLEARLDVVLFRACFFPSIRTARQWINHNKILVNNQLVNSSSYQLKPGDVVSIKAKYNMLLIKQIMQFFKKNFLKKIRKNHKNFIISISLFKKLVSFLKPLFNNQFLINNLKQIYLYSQSLCSLTSRLTATQGEMKIDNEQPKVNNIASLKLDLNSEKMKLIAHEKTLFPVTLSSSRSRQGNGGTIMAENVHFALESYKQFLSQVKQLLRSSLRNKYSNNNYLKNTNSAILNSNQLEKNPLLFNLVELELLEKLEAWHQKAPFALPSLPSTVALPATAKVKKQGNGTIENLRHFLTHLKLKKFFFKSDKKKDSFSILNMNVLKPLNLEISYKNLVIIYLYPPQKIPFACNIDMQLISRSLV